MLVVVVDHEDPNDHKAGTDAAQQFQRPVKIVNRPEKERGQDQETGNGQVPAFSAVLFGKGLGSEYELFSS